MKNTMLSWLRRNFNSSLERLGFSFPEKLVVAFAPQGALLSHNGCVLSHENIFSGLGMI